MNDNAEWAIRMGELIVVMVKGPHEEASDEENTKVKIEATVNAARIGP